MTEKAVVLAAGRGTRLGPHTDACAKALVHVAGRPLIDYVLHSLVRAGVRESVIVLGYRGEQLEAYLGTGERFGLRLHYAWNRDYTTGNARSLWHALHIVGGEPFLLVMSDHICSASLLRTFLACADGRSALAVDRTEMDERRTHEATKVALADGLVVGIGKGLTHWDAVDTGVSHWSAGAFAALDGQPAQGELAALMWRMTGAEGGLAGCDVSGHFWIDVDTEEERRLAERLLQANAHLLD